MNDEQRFYLSFAPSQVVMTANVTQPEPLARRSRKDSAMTEQPLTTFATVEEAYRDKLWEHGLLWWLRPNNRGAMYIDNITYDSGKARYMLSFDRGVEFDLPANEVLNYQLPVIAIEPPTLTRQEADELDALHKQLVAQFDANQLRNATPAADDASKDARDDRSPE